MEKLRNQNAPGKNRSHGVNCSLEQRLANYALAATAAGAGLLASALPAEAQVVYTPAHVLIKPGSTYNLDVNRDRTTDFEFTNAVFSHLDSFYVTPFGSSPWGQNGNGVEVLFDQPFVPAALARGAKIGGSRLFYGSCIGCVSTRELMAWAGPNGDGGEWLNASDRYLGLRIFVNRQAHFGWARFSVRTMNGALLPLLTGYAFEITPNKPIMAGQTSDSGGDSDAGDSPISRELQATPLGVLALGAPGIPLWRKGAGAAQSGAQ